MSEQPPQAVDAVAADADPPEHPQALALHLLARMDAERAAVARALHDDVGSALAALRFDLQWIGRHGGQAVAARAGEALGALDAAIAASQRIMRGLRPAVLDAGIVPALEWHVGACGERAGLAVQFTCNRDRIDLAPGPAMTVFSVAQESLDNIARHADATEVSVDLIEHDGVLSLEIGDNGRGFADGDLAKPGAFGLRCLAERARAAGGWLDVTSAGGRTTVLLIVPITEAAAQRLGPGAQRVRTGAWGLRAPAARAAPAAGGLPGQDGPT